MIAEAEPSFFADPKRLIQTGVAVVLLLVAIYVLVPRLFDLQDAIGRIKEGDPIWIATGVVCCVAMFAAYVALFRGVVGEQVIHLEWRESYEITMAGLAATRLFSAGGAGGILLTYWALRKAGMERRQSVCRMVAFLVVLYSIYLLALVLFGILLRTHVISGEAPLSGTVIPPPRGCGDRGRAADRASPGRHRTADRAAYVGALRPNRSATRHGAGDTRSGHPHRDRVRAPSEQRGAHGGWRDRLLGANIAILWASFHAFDVSVPLGVVIQGFFLGMLANLVPFAPGGVGAVDAGMIGAFVLFGIPGAEVFAAVLTYRVIAFWLPIPPGSSPSSSSAIRCGDGSGRDASGPRGSTWARPRPRRPAAELVTNGGVPLL